MFSKKISLLLLIILLFLSILSLSYQNIKSNSTILSTNGEIIRYLKANLYSDETEEILCVYKNIINKKYCFAIFSLENLAFKKLYDIELDPSFLFFSIAKLDKNISQIILFDENNIYAIKLLLNDYKIEKLFNIKKLAFSYQFNNDFPFIPSAYDINNDGIDELFVFTVNNIEIFENAKLAQSYPYQAQAYYNHKASFGGVSSSQNILIVLPDIIIKDINNDGFKDIILKYQTKIEYSFYDNNIRQFSKPKILDLSKYISVRAGYSFFNDYIKILNFDKDNFADILVLNFNMASVFNADKTGILCYLYKGTKDGWQSSPSNQFFIEELSGLESKLFFTDFNNDGYIDLVNIGSKLFSSNFFLSLSVKRSIPVYISFYPQINSSFSKSAILQIEKGISLDNQNLLDSSQLSFDFFSTFDMPSIVSEVIVNHEIDLNNDNIIDYIIYNFDGSFSFYLSNLSAANIFQKKENFNILVSNEFLSIYYLSGPYTLILKGKNNFYLINIIKKQGKIYINSLKI